jgi:hypothetical protein
MQEFYYAVIRSILREGVTNLKEMKENIEITKSRNAEKLG